MSEAPVKCRALPKGYKSKRFKCNWCGKTVLGNNFLGKHGKGLPGHAHLSYTEVGQPSLCFFPQPTRTQTNNDTEEIKNEERRGEEERRNEEKMRKEEEEKNQEEEKRRKEKDRIKEEEERRKEENGREKEENGRKKEEKPSLIDVKTKQGVKRKRQKSLFEMCGKIAGAERTVENILATIADLNVEGYLKEVKDCIAKLKILTSEVQDLKSRKKQKLKKFDDQIIELGELKEVMKDSLKDSHRMRKETEKRDSKILRMKKPPIERKVDEHELQRVIEKFRESTLKVLQEYHDFDINESGDKLVCRTCVENWEKTKSKRKPSGIKIAVLSHLNYTAGRHVDSIMHVECEKAKDSYQLNRAYYEAVLNDAQTRIEKMTDNVIRVIYFVIEENIAMRKCESLYNLLDYNICKSCNT